MSSDEWQNPGERGEGERDEGAENASDERREEAPEGRREEAPDEPAVTEPEPAETAATEELGPGPEAGAGGAARTERPGPRRLLRSAEDRMIFGVSGGLGGYFDVDPVIFRIAFAVSVFFGGLGVLAYLALAVFVPSDDGGARPLAPVQRSTTLAVVAGLVALFVVVPVLGVGFELFDGPWGIWGISWLLIPLAIVVAAYALVSERRRRGESLGVGGILLIALAVVAIAIGLAGLAIAAAVVTGIGHGLIVGGIVLGLGALLVVLAFTGGGRWLIAPALALAVGVAGAAAADLDLEGGIGKEEHRPTTAAAVPAEGYELGIGQLVVDLRDVDWRDGEVLDLGVDVGVGEVAVAVPASVCVESRAEVGAGAIDVAGEETDGIGVDQDQLPPSSDGPRLRIDGDVDIGALHVANDDDVELEQDEGGWRFEDSAARQAANRRACS